MQWRVFKQIKNENEFKFYNSDLRIYMYGYCCNNLLPAVEIHSNSGNSYIFCDELVYHLLLRLKSNKEVIM